MSLCVKQGSIITNFQADADANNINGTVPGANGIVLTNFSGLLLENGTVVADIAAAVADITAAPWNFSIDNVIGGSYRVNIDLPNQSYYTLMLKHSANLVSWNSEDFDVQLHFNYAAELALPFNWRWQYTIAAAPVAARNVAVGVLEYADLFIKYTADAESTTSPRFTERLYAWYTTLGDHVPIRMSPEAA